jgi:hypothetical protein
MTQEELKAVTRGNSKDTPKPRFCLVCEEVIISTERDFMAMGHVNNFDHAHKKYALTEADAKKAVAKLRSGVYGREYSNLEVKV